MKQGTLNCIRSSYCLLGRLSPSLRDCGTAGSSANVDKSSKVVSKIEHRVTEKLISNLLKVKKDGPNQHGKKDRGKWQTLLGLALGEKSQDSFAPSLQVIASTSYHSLSHLGSITKSYAYYLSFAGPRIKSCPFLFSAEQMELLPSQVSVLLILPGVFQPPHLPTGRFY